MLYPFFTDYVPSIDGMFEHISLKSPSQLLHASYIQTVCLSKNVFANPNDIQALANVHNGDLRQSLHTLQFWIDSYAGSCDPGGCRRRTCDPGGCDRKIDTDYMKASEQTGSLEVASVDRKVNVALSRHLEVELSKSQEIGALSESTCRTLEPAICISEKTSEISHTKMEDTTSNEWGQTLSHASQEVSMPRPVVHTASLTPGSNLEGQLDRTASIPCGIEEGTSKGNSDSLGKDGCNNESKIETVNQSDVSRSGKGGYVMHEFSMESFLGLRNVTSNNIGGALEVLRSGTKDGPSKVRFIDQDVSN